MLRRNYEYTSMHLVITENQQVSENRYHIEEKMLIMDCIQNIIVNIIIVY